MNPKTKRRVIGWVVTVLVLALLATAALVTISLMNQARDPAAQVQQYLDHLANGEAAEASAMVDPGLSNGEAALLTDEALGSATEWLKVRSVETIERTGSEARVRAQMSLGGERFEHTFTVDRGPREMLVLDTWELNEPLLAEVAVELWGGGVGLPTTVAVGASEINVAASPAFDNEPQTLIEARATVYPAVYAVTAQAGPYFEPIEAPSLALPGRSSGSEAAWLGAFTPSVELEQAILQQAQAFAEGCVSVAGNSVVSGNMDALCPSITRNTRLASLSVTVAPTGFEQIGNYWFETEAFEFEVVSSSTSNARPSSDRAILVGDIEWVEGEPIISRATFELW